MPPCLTVGVEILQGLVFSGVREIRMMRIERPPLQTRFLHLTAVQKL